MITATTVAASLGADSRARRVHPLLLGLGVTVLLGEALGMAALCLYLLFYAWQTADWFAFWLPSAAFAACLVVAGPALLFRLLAHRPLTGAARAANERAEVLGQLLTGANDQSAPLVPMQPAPQTLSGPSSMALTIPTATHATFGRGMSTEHVQVAALVALPFVVLAAVGGDGSAFSGVPVLSALAQTPSAPFNPLLDILPFVIVCVPWIARLWEYRRQRRGVRIVVDDQGIKWGDGRDSARTRLMWGDVRALGRVSAPTTTVASVGVASTYVIAGAETSLAWSTNARTPARLFADGETLLRLAVTRTGKPLRDATALATEVAQAGRNPRLLLESHVVGVPGQTLFPSNTASTSARGQMGRGGVVALLISIVLFVGAGALLGGGYLLQQRQSAYLTSLPTLLHREQPLFADDMLVSDGVWPVRKPSKSSYQGMAYTPLGYQLSGNQPGNSVVALSTAQAGDAAYEVTATQTGALTPSGGDGVGLVFHSDQAADDFMALIVGYNGQWSLQHYRYVDDQAADNWDYVDGGHSDAIKTGSGERNTLLVVARGTQYIIYINGQYVTSENDTYYTDLPTGGYAGVYLDDCALTGTFQNFAIYHVRPLHSLSFSYI